MEALTLDAGALIAIERNDRAMWTLLKDATDADSVPIVPATSLAQVWRGGPRTARLALALRQCRVEPLDESQAKRTGELLGLSGKADIADAAVVVSAAASRASIVTADVADIRALMALVPEVGLIDLNDL